MKLQNFLPIFLFGCNLVALPQNAKTDNRNFKIDDRQFFGLIGPVKSVSIDGDSEEIAAHSIYNFDEEGKIINGELWGWGFCVDYSRNKDGKITIFGEYDGEEDIHDNLIRNQHGELIKWGYWRDYDENYSETIILEKDEYGNPLVEKTKGNDGHDWPDADSGDYIEQTINEYVYDDFGNWISCYSLSERHYLKPQTTFMGEPTSQDETFSYHTQRTITYFDTDQKGNEYKMHPENLVSFGATFFLNKNGVGFDINPLWDKQLMDLGFKKHYRRKVWQGEGEWPDTYIIEFETPYVFENENKKICVFYTEYEQYDDGDMTLNGIDSYIYIQFFDSSDEANFLNSIYDLGFEKKDDFGGIYYYLDDGIDYYHWVINEDKTIKLDHEH